MSSVKKCPTVGCNTYFIKIDNVNVIKCPKCVLKFCWKCHKHKGMCPKKEHLLSSDVKKGTLGIIIQKE